MNKKKKYNNDRNLDLSGPTVCVHGTLDEEALGTIPVRIDLEGSSLGEFCYYGILTSSTLSLLHCIDSINYPTSVLNIFVTTDLIVAVICCLATYGFALSVQGLSYIPGKNSDSRLVIFGL